MKIDRIDAVSIRDGDVVVLTTDMHLTQEQARALKAQMMQELRLAGIEVKVVLLSGGLKLPGVLNRAA